MRLVFDTNAYVLCDAKKESALAAVENAVSLFLPAVVYGELYYGFRHGRKFLENINRLDRFIRDFDVSVISVDVEVARLFGDVYAHLRKKGKPIPTNDIWIAASCMSVGGTLLTADHHFLDVEQIQVRLVEA